MLCKYKDIFGKPRQGLHSYRFLDFAIIDTVATLLLAKIYVYYFNKNNSLLFVFLLLFFSSVFIHKLFCVDTTLTRIFS